MKIEKLDKEYTNPVELNDDEVLSQVKKCFKSKEWILTGDTLVLYSEKGLPDAVRVITIKNMRTYVDRDSETWRERGIPRKSPEEMKILKEQMYEAIKNSKHKLRALGEEFESGNIVWKVISYVESEPNGEIRELVKAVREVPKIGGVNVI